MRDQQRVLIAEVVDTLVREYCYGTHPPATPPRSRQWEYVSAAFSPPTPKAFNPIPWSKGVWIASEEMYPAVGGVSNPLVVDSENIWLVESPIDAGPL
jgi:hypothetical protein